MKTRLAIIGYGKMGKLVHKHAKERGYEVNAIIDPSEADATHKEVTKESLEKIDVCIEFSNAEAIFDNVRKISELQKNHVVASTGWYEDIDVVKEIVKKNNTGLIWASNFSLGVNLFFKIVEDASKLVNNLEDYDIFGYELHHNRKADSPSGTAKTLSKILLDNIDRKTKLVEDKIDRKINKEELHFASIRGGDIPGTHVVGFDSTADTIELKHTARNRDGFAIGSILAADWLKEKKGFFDIKDMMKDIIK
jgi:4-hydroxy-tetrahydrodipicolinate reductase